MTTPDQPKPPTVLKFRSASGRTEIARRPDGTISLHVLAGHDVLADGDIVAAAAALVVGEEAAYERGVAAGRAQVERATDACPACTEESAYIDGHAHVTDYGYVLYDPQHRQDLAGGLVAEGRRQATEGWEREWGLALHGHPGQCVLNEHAARGIAADPTAPADTKVLSRLVGPWEAAEQTQPDFTPHADESLSLAQGTFAAQAQALDPETFRRESLGTWPAEQDGDSRG